MPPSPLRSSFLTFAEPVSALGVPLGSWKHWSATMSYNARCWTQQAAALAAAMIFLTGCEGGGFDILPSACLPVVEYSRTEQARVGVEVAMLPEGSVIIEWLADYAVLRDQVRACR